ncbi:unnamed protein product [Chrysodeixis includens]|uniref:Uncharacterized protein n=1 Tax=Chrysodeixis includens TaxID=689277 RepID=A0A9P0GUE9_CHRIL|nr:unnamed protein product [Chrysodeixis includens]
MADFWRQIRIRLTCNLNDLMDFRLMGVIRLVFTVKATLASTTRPTAGAVAFLRSSQACSLAWKRDGNLVAQFPALRYPPLASFERRRRASVRATSTPRRQRWPPNERRACAALASRRRGVDVRWMSRGHWHDHDARKTLVWGVL